MNYLRNKEWITPRKVAKNDEWMIYIRLHGSYECLDGGNLSDALVDFTGGVAELIQLHSDTGDQLVKVSVVKQAKTSLFRHCGTQVKGLRVQLLIRHPTLFLNRGSLEITSI